MTESAMVPPRPHIDRLPPAVAILAAPGRTMRRILYGRQFSATLPLVLLAFLSIAVSDRDQPPFRVAAHAALNANVGLTVILVALCAAVVFVALFYLFSWVAHIIERVVFHGEGDVRDVRLAAAWGLAPLAWALVYRIPFAVWSFLNRSATAGSTSVDLTLIGDHVLLAVTILALDLTTFAAYMVISTLTIATAHRITAGEALGTLLLTFATPAVLVVAAVLATR